jgi:CRP-like cAMP-binding protein
MPGPTLTAQRLKRLLQEYAQAVQESPSNLVLRLKLAFVMHQLGRRDEAVEMCRNAAVAYAQDGHLVQAMAVCKGILAIDPGHSETQSLLASVAEEQGRRQQAGMIRILGDDGQWFAVPAPGADPDQVEVGVSAQPDDERGDKAVRTAVGVPAAPSVEAPAVPSVEAPAVPSGLPALFETTLPAGRAQDQDHGPEGWVSLGPMLPSEDFLSSEVIESQVKSEAALMGGEMEPILRPDSMGLAVGLGVADREEARVREALRAPMPSARPPSEIVPVPLLSALPRDAFVELLRVMPMQSAPAGAVILREGEPGDAFYIVVRGSVRVLKNQLAGPPVEVARLSSGAFFGEFALLSDSVRHASVEAVEPVELFEISRALLEDLGARFPEVTRTVWRFYRERLIETLIATAPFFALLSTEERAAVAGRLRARRYPAGAEILVEGGRHGGLHLVLLGEVVVSSKRADGSPVVLARLQEGSYFGEISLLRGGAPPLATVTAAKDVEIVELPSRDFYDVLSRHPDLWSALKQEAERREHETAALVSGEARQAEPEIYLV